MNIRRIVVLTAVAGVIGGGLWLAYRPVPQLIQGMADADSINVSAKITARVRELQVREGDRVEAGQLLFELDGPEVEARRRQASAALASARAQEAKAREGTRREEIRAAEAAWRRAVAATTLARLSHERTDKLIQANFVSRQKRDESQAQLDETLAAEALARAQYEQALAGVRAQDRAAAEAQVRQAKGALAEAQAINDEVQGRAPLGAEISRRHAEVGELVPAGQPVFNLIDVDRMWVALNVREDQFAGLGIGSRLRGDIPALGLKGVEFAVYFINPAGDFATWRATRQSAGYDVRTFEVRVRPLHPVPRLRPGMSVLFGWPQG